MFKEFIKKIQSLEESERRRLLIIMTVISGVFVLAFWASQFRSIIENQNQMSAKIPPSDEMPSVGNNLKSSAKELWGIFSNIFSNLEDYLKTKLVPEAQQITPAPQPHSDGSLPPAVRLPTE